MTVLCFCCGKRVEDGNFQDFYNKGIFFITNENDGNRVATTIKQFKSIGIQKFYHGGGTAFKVICLECKGSGVFDNIIQRKF